MKSINITTSKGGFLLVDDDGKFPRDFPHDFYNKIGYVNKLTEEEASDIVEEPEYIPCGNCLSGCPVCSGYGYSISWVSELHSLLQANGIDINNGNWYLFRKV